MVVKEKGDPIDDQYDPPRINERVSPLPDPLGAVLPETAVPVADFRELGERESIVHVMPLLSLGSGFGAVCERFAIQYEDTGYGFENFQPGWQTVEEVDGANQTEEELLEALADAVRDWHAEIAEISSAMSGQHVDEETVEAMHVELKAEVERKGYGHL